MDPGPTAKNSTNANVATTATYRTHSISSCQTPFQIESNDCYVIKFYHDEQRDRDEDAKDEHAAQAPQMERPASGSVHQKDGHDRHHHHDSANAFIQIKRYV